MSALAQIYHFEQITDRIGCSGQPTREQFAAIHEAGFEAVINLALADSDHAIADEGNLVTALGMTYVHIPVKFDDPTVDDLRLFCDVMRSLAHRRVWVHCVVNARVSAFLYHYLRVVEGRSEAESRTQLLDRWSPTMDEVWRRFLAIERSAIAAA